MDGPGQCRIWYVNRKVSEPRLGDPRDKSTDIKTHITTVYIDFLGSASCEAWYFQRASDYVRHAVVSRGITPLYRWNVVYT